MEYTLFNDKMKIKLKIKTNNIQQYLNDFGCYNKTSFPKKFQILSMINQSKFIETDQLYKNYYEIDSNLIRNINIKNKLLKYNKEDIDRHKKILKQINNKFSKLKWQVVGNELYINNKFILFIDDTTILPISKHDTYQSYLKSKKWDEIRKRIFELDNNTCLICGCTDNLHCHHLGYSNLYKETDNDLATLCKKCHEDEHNKIRNRGMSINDYYEVNKYMSNLIEKNRKQISP